MGLVNLFSEETMVVLLLDDERDFKDGRKTLVARSSDQALELTENLTELDELWLDYVLRGSDSTDQFLSALRRRKLSGSPLTLHKVYIHTSSWSAVSLLVSILTEDLDVPEGNIVRVEHREFFVG